MDVNIALDKAEELLKLLESPGKKVYKNDLPEPKKYLSKEQEAIKKFLEERHIHYLVHFTDRENIPTIRKYGLLSINELKRRKMNFKSNDESRLDMKLNYISLSVSNMNKKLYQAFKNRKMEYGVLILIRADILFEEIQSRPIYCDRNAAASSVCEGETFEYLQNMFAPCLHYFTYTSGAINYDRELDERLPYETTDPQAEILIPYVDPKYIDCYWDLEEDFFYGD